MKAIVLLLLTACSACTHTVSQYEPVAQHRAVAREHDVGDVENCLYEERK